MVEPIVIKTKDLWIKATIPCVSDNRIRKIISDYYSKYKNVLKSMKGKKDYAKFKNKCSKLKSHAAKTLCDISSCKCRTFSVFSCARDANIPEREQAFLTDERTSRKIAIGGVDAAALK